LCSIIGAGHLAQHSFAERRVIEDDIDRLIEEWTFGVDKWRIGDVLQASGIAAAPVEDLSDTYDRDPQLGDHYQIVHQPSAPDVDIPIDAEPARWIGADHRLTRSPELGEHNHEIVVDLLGRSQAHYEALVESGVLS
jgi:crotonobetainyl-CoA:carnitine CoA-transferase CaiB-like acyl-CoA transferase